MKKYLYAAFLVIALAAVLAPAQLLAADEEKPFTIHGEVRFRGEYTNNAQDFADTDDDLLVDTDDGAFFWAYRARIAAEGRFTKNVVGWIEFQQTGAGGEDIGVGGPRQIDDRNSDTHLYQGKITLNKLWKDSFSMTFGRQEMLFGNEFLFGDEDFYGGIAHDGITASWDLKNWDITAFWTRPIEDSVDTVDVDVTPDLRTINPDADNVDMVGGYAVWSFGKNLKQTLDFYLIDTFNRGTSGNFQTVGARYAHDVTDKNGLFWNAELALQFGTAAEVPVAGAGVGDDEVDASGMGGEGWVGYNLHSGKNNHRFWGRVEYATGDDVTSTDEFEGFIGLFGEFHNRTGHGDWFHVQETDLNGVGPYGLGPAGGLMAVAVGYTGYFSDKHEVGGAFWDYSLEEDNGAPTGDGLGSAFDVWYAYNYSRNVAFQASYSVLSPDDALTGGGAAPDDSAERLYGQIRLRF